MQKAIAIVGPTASGKSALGVYLAKKLRGEVVSADSRQVYKGLNIGTGKITKKEMAGVPHHLLDISSPKKQFTADNFVKKASQTFTTIYRRGATPFVVGGTGFYVDALLGRLSLSPVAPNFKLRKQLEKKTPAQLLTMLKKLDPARAKTIEPQNTRRIIRAIEIAKALGKVPKIQTESKYDILWLGINPGIETLEKKINMRLRARIKAGMISEAKRLRKSSLSYKRMEELGLEYRSLARYLQGRISKEEMIAELERAIRMYAKRQIRWFKRNPDIHWVKNKTEALQLSKKFLSGR